MIKKKKLGRPQSKTPEFRMMVAQEVIGKKLTYREACQNYGVSSGAISAWVRQYKSGKLLSSKVYEEPRFKIARLEENIGELKAEIAELYLQNQVLKKSIAYVNSKTRGSSSVITSENLDQYRGDAE